MRNDGSADFVDKLQYTVAMTYLSVYVAHLLIRTLYRTWQ